MTKSARKRLKEKARKGRRAAEAAGELEVAPSPAPPPVFKTLREKKSAQASAEGWAAEVARAEELYEELRERAPALPPWRQVGAREVPDGGAGRVPARARGKRFQGDDHVPWQGARRARYEQDDAEGGKSAVSAVNLFGTVRRYPGFAVRLSDQGSGKVVLVGKMVRV